MISKTEYHSAGPDFKRFVMINSALVTKTSNLAFFCITYFCFQGANFGVSLAKIGQTELTHANRK
jgi:hypothetical protein